jgi:hypothetical protein
MSLTPKNWGAFQHYKDRSPAWIKLHRGLLDDFAYHRLPVASRALAPLLWLLASDHEQGKITATVEEMAFRLHMAVDDLSAALKPLIDSGFFIDDSNVLAACKQVAIPEREKEEQEEKEGEKNIGRSSTRPKVNADFEKFWEAYPKRKGANPKTPAEKLFVAAVKVGVAPAKMIRAAELCAQQDRDKIGTEFIPQAVKWLRDGRWNDYLEAAETKPAIQLSGFYATFDSAELDAWATYERTPGATKYPRDKTGGWRFPSQWPPGHEGIPAFLQRKKDAA